MGRDDELNRVSKLLGESRLVILTGPGGTGKTRLAIEAAARLTDQMPDGVWFVALAPVGDALDVPQAVLSVIGPPDPIWVPDADPVRAVLPPLDRLADMLATRQLVLVLDNCEHLIGAVARLAGRVLAEAPGVRILATSREPLGVTGETLCPVPSLPLPPDGATPAEALEYGSVRLLAERGAAVRPGFTIDEVSVEPVIRICQPAELGDRDHFLTARWVLFSVLAGRPLFARAEHPPWPLRRAEALTVDDSLIAAAGLPAPQGEPLVHYSPGVDVRIGRPQSYR